MRTQKISREDFIKSCAAAAGTFLLPAPGGSFAGQRPPSERRQPLQEPVRRGSWVRRGTRQTGDLLLADKDQGCVLVINDKASTAIHQAARFLAADIQKLCGYQPPIVSTVAAGKVNIRLAIFGIDEIPADIPGANWKTEPEAYRIVTREQTLWLAGADFRGTAFATYALSERLGIDPLYWWTGYEPEQRDSLIIKETDFRAGPPVFRYRGFFHDDEDILQRPFEANGYPWRFGDIPMEWYQRWFETALRLGMNTVAPYTRAHRRKEVQQCASDWGLFYTSHHYDILLSNPFGIERFNLAEKRKIDPTWDWFTNRKGMTGYWQGGVEENKDLHTIWPVGLRGTDDHAYAFPVICRQHSG